MKRITFFMIMAVALAGCQETIVLSEKVETFEAIVEGFEGNTKTSIDNQKNILWSENDRLAIFQGCSIADKYQVTAETAGTGNGTFELIADNSGDVNDDFNSGVEIATNIALYPYADGLSVSNTNVTNGNDVGAYEITGVVLPEIQYYIPNSFGEGTFPMVAVTATMSDHTLKFKNVLGAMKLQLKGTQTIKLIKIEGKNNEKLSGAATVTAYANGITPAVTMTGTDEASKSVTLDCGDGVELAPSTATDFIIALPPVLFSQGFTVTITYSDDTTNTIETTTANTVLRSSILTMPSLILGKEVIEDGEGDTDSSIKVLGIAFDKSTLTLAPSTSYSLITVVVPDAAEDKTLIWSSNDPTIATVDQSGVVTAVSDGTASITAVAVGGASKSCTVNVISIPTSVATIDYVDEYGVNHGKGVAIGGTVWAPVNCGYKAATDTDKGYTYGKLYQWGRKYGQGYSEEYDSEPILYDAPVSATVGQDKSMQDYFFVGQSDWIESWDDKLWNSGTDKFPVKTNYDPCPIGWRIPTYDELNALHTEHSDWTTDKNGKYGYYFSGVVSVPYDTPPLREDVLHVFLPAAGFHSGYDDNISSSRGDTGGYWSSYSSLGGRGNYAYALYFFDRGAGMEYGGSHRPRAMGYSVRCVQE